MQGAHWRRSQDRPEHLTHAAKTRSPSARSLRDESLKTEIRRVLKNQLLGAGGPQDARVTVSVTWPAVPSNASWVTWACAESDAPSLRAPRAVRRESSARPTLVRRHVEVFAPGGLWVADVPPRAGGAPSYVARLLRVGLCGFRDRRVLAEDHRLADLHESVHRPGPRRPGDGRLAAETSGGRPDGPGASLATEGCSTGPSATGPPCPTARQSPQ